LISVVAGDKPSSIMVVKANYIVVGAKGHKTTNSRNLHKILSVGTVHDPDGTKQKIKDFYAKMGKFPRKSSKDKEEKNLGSAMSRYCNPNNATLYDPEFAAWARSLGKRRRSSPGFWNLDNLIEQAKKFDSLKRWGLGHPSSYKVAQEKDIQREIATQLGWSIEARKGFYTYETLLASASKFTKKKDWVKNEGKFSQQANKLKVMDRIAAELNWTPEKIHWDFDKCKESASKFNSLAEWCKGCTGSYKAAYELGITRDVTNSLGWRDGRSLRTKRKTGLPNEIL